jgi:F1F0 ATPase subunit 2
MTDAVVFALALLAGLALGAMFFGGLYWTIRQAMSSKRPALWFVASVALRTSSALAGFYLVGHDHWQRLLACLLGFFLARLTTQWLTRPAVGNVACPSQGIGRAT